ncbi:hypothetical protein ASB7_04340 [Helicobacter ailurogastricus]|nr:hypothetical protein ASB7_04340 [Helicobacter ailurogastricus]
MLRTAMKRYNFKNFLKDYKVEIPILQRDYVQGRRDQKSIATKFLNTLFEVLNGERGKLHLDFIYGYEKDKKFIPIDGQQRITTLWLLHLYLYKLASKLDTVDQRTCKSVRDILKNFTYSVRTGSKDFCKALVLDSEKKFENSLKSQTIRPSKAIRDASSAFGGLKNLDNDPTIGAMLCMLDLIYDHCCNKYECCSESKEKNKKGIARLKKNLKNLENITFDVFNMGKFELGEDLYIKMNARGKQLSPYENLKAFMEEKLNIKDHAQLLRHIENKWSDYFFEGEPEKFDIGGLRFLHYANIFFKYSQGINKVDDSDDIHNLDRPVGEFYAPLQDIENIRSLDRVMNILKKTVVRNFLNLNRNFLSN